MNNIFEIKLKNFDMDATFECGQAFRWVKNENSYINCAFNRVIEVEYNKNNERLKIINSNKEDISNIWSDYFDLENNYEEIISYLSSKDPHIKKAISFASGLRILNQDPWETILSFIISQNNNILRIKNNIEDLSKNFSFNKIEYKGKTFYPIPSPNELRDLTIEDLKPIKLGYRDKYIIETSKRMCELFPNGITREEVSDLSNAELEKLLTSFSGIGPKVANCIMLFSFKRFDSFPIDTWVKKLMNHFYGFSKNDLKGMTQFANDNFYPYGGIAQQYLFHYVRNNQSW